MISDEDFKFLLQETIKNKEKITIALIKGILSNYSIAMKK